MPLPETGNVHQIQKPLMLFQLFSLWKLNIIYKWKISASEQLDFFQFLLVLMIIIFPVSLFILSLFFSGCKDKNTRPDECKDKGEVHDVVFQVVHDV